MSRGSTEIQYIGHMDEKISIHCLMSICSISFCLFKNSQEYPIKEMRYFYIAKLKNNKRATNNSS